jgi:3-oxoacyl-[acyl-carrier protein] reductase
MDLNLTGKIALVTGASRGLGYAAALQLSREGARVAINSRYTIKLHAAARQIESETTRPVLALPGDIVDPAVPTQLINQTISALGGVDILICNAGGPPPGTFESFDDPAWQKAVELSFLNQVRLIRAALPYLKKSKAASILTVTSMSVKQPLANLELSNSIRAATVGLTKSLAMELGPLGIRVNSILPGWTETERVTQLLSVRAAANQTTIEEELNKVAKDSPLGRIGTPQEFANAATFLVSPAASFITGVMLTVDGGMVKGTF